MTRYLQQTAAAAAAILLACGTLVPVAFAPPTGAVAVATVPALA